MTRTCIIGDCERAVYAKSMCEAHYARQRMGFGMSRKLANQRGTLKMEIEKAILSSTDECINWPFYRRHNGYPSARIDGKQRDVHRYVCSRVYGEPSDASLVAGHSCNNKQCINPRHLSWMTQSQNLYDAWKIRKEHRNGV